MSAEDATYKKAISLLFKRPHEPTFTPKDGGNSILELPESFYPDRYKEAAGSISTRFGTDTIANRIEIPEISEPDFSFANKIRRDGDFNLFNQKHQEIAGQLISLFMRQPNIKSFASVAAYARERLNPYLFQYALYVASQHRQDTKNDPLPSIVSTFPENFINPSKFNELKTEGSVNNVQDRRPVSIPLVFTASESEQEQRLAYFREDIGINMHHWHWHLVYPTRGGDLIVKKDRRGELFYYMHSQIIARYNADRFASGLQAVKRLTDLRAAVPEAYFPKLLRSSHSRTFPPRFENSVLKDVNRPGDSAVSEIGDLERWRDRIYQAIDQGFVETPDRQRVELDEVRGIDILGDMIEPSELTPNANLYGSLHNTGHDIISFVHDPDNRQLESSGVMGGTATAMRDPIFYRWHAFIDSIFQRHKNRLTPYTDQQLGFSNVTVSNVSVQTRSGVPANTFITYWQLSQVDLNAGLDFAPEGDVYAEFTHLQHAEFTYNFTVNNSGNASRGTCRIFIAPRVNERGAAIPFNERKNYIIELDKWDVPLSSGQNKIQRKSTDSSVTIPYERSFRDISTAAKTATGSQAAFEFCGCGWPHHMLLPKGNEAGVQYDLFVMVSNGADDAVNQTFNPTIDFGNPSNEACNDAYSFCGLRDMLYPDRRSMGYPFDRRIEQPSLDAFANAYSNMAMQQVTIRFSNRYVNRT